MIGLERLIPTRHKRKISHELSYPLGAEAISRALKGIALYDQLSIQFIVDPWTVARQKTERLLFSCKHSSRAAEFSRDWTDPFGVPFFAEWQINVYAVPMGIRHRVQMFLLEDALPKVRAWFTEQSKKPLEGEQVIEFVLDVPKDEFVSRLRNEPRPTIGKR